MRRIRLNPRMTPIGGPLREQCPLHLVPGGGGGGEPVVPGSADEDKDLPLLEEDLVPPLLRGLPQRRSRLGVDAVLGGEGHEGRDVAARGVAVRGGGGACPGQSKHPCGGAGPPTQHPTR